MEITQEELQKAIRIGRAIQEHLEQIGADDLRSTDLYPVLVRKKLIEKDKYKGIHFRRFLRKLKDNDLLNLIPQCKFKYSESNAGLIEWHFYRNKIKLGYKSENAENRKLITPRLPENEIDELIIKAKSHIEKLPKKNSDEFTFAQLETRKMFARAYEIWSARELEIMQRAYNKFGRIDKVAELLERQPSVVEKKIIKN